ncbi:uncharacterized protein Dwil_GK17323 [Drosophila willistoni]|uniref:RRM domain-containing protein n=1 Tax=Drosophila willistoni TaxID=7260 RepID=B4NQ68_DROWI|nr:probable RNA-binding protein CG14230 [Drosophila willistoni]EDW86293.1 uncharacterized protein Dwil_GK17323 [Drosophila willistoni]
MGSTRFFLADLPSRTNESDLIGLFQDYGQVQHVDLKRKDEDETQAAKVIAFVTVQSDDAQYCVNELNWQKLHGAKLKVSLAKESFLDRLKREREENQQKDQQQSDYTQYNENSSQLLKQNTQNKRRVFGEDEEIGDDEIAPELLITKKRASHSIHNGKIVIQQEHDVKPLHVIENYKKSDKRTSKDAIVSKAEQKRKESQNKMRQEHQQKKSAIQMALSSEGIQSKRIKFSDAEEEDETEKKPTEKPKRDIFAADQDDDEEEDENVLLPQYAGKKGERLVELQSKQSLDPRFRITGNFVDDEEDEAENDDEDKSQTQENERNWQMGILEQVVGHKLTNESGSKGESKKKKMLRFDPAKEDDQKLVRQKPIAKESPEDKRDNNGTSASAPAPAAAVVSKSAFYMVTDTLKESLNMRGEGFSLLDMFGSAHDEELAKRQGQLEKLSNEKILVNKSNAHKLDLVAVINPFSYDSSDSENDEESAKKPPQTEVNENEAPANATNQSKKKMNKIQMESFFIPKNDPRLKEGAKFFKVSKAEVMAHADYDQVKNRLKLLITNKIAKTKKNQPAKDMMKNRHKKNTKQIKSK